MGARRVQSYLMRSYDEVGGGIWKFLETHRTWGPDRWTGIPPNCGQISWGDSAIEPNSWFFLLEARLENEFTPRHRCMADWLPGLVYKVSLAHLIANICRSRLFRARCVRCLFAKCSGFSSTVILLPHHLQCSNRS